MVGECVHASLMYQIFLKLEDHTLNYYIQKQLTDNGITIDCLYRIPELLRDNVYVYVHDVAQAGIIYEKCYFMCNEGEIAGIVLYTTIDSLAHTLRLFMNNNINNPLSAIVVEVPCNYAKEMQLKQYHVGMFWDWYLIISKSKYNIEMVVSRLNVDSVTVEDFTNNPLVFQKILNKVSHMM